MARLTHSREPGAQPRAALLSIHARVAGPGPSTWEDPSLVQLWGPRYNVFVVAACDLAVFSLGTLPDDARGRRRAQAYLLRYGADRDLLVPDADRRRALWTPRVWPGGVLVGGEIAGTWRRADAVMTVQPWRQVSRAERDAVTAEAESLPLPGTGRRVAVRWDD